MPNNTKYWDSLGKTDPDHTKGFTRGGGFSGTALKPMWVIMRMTEEFGPCGQGWGIHQPTFTIEHAEAESLVFCTVAVWYEKPDQVLWGVGGDKFRSLVKRGKPDEYIQTDDEAFKKAYTDAVNNALKYLGVGADIHMGRFDDSKYVADLRAEKNKAPSFAAMKRELETLQQELLDAPTKALTDDLAKLWRTKMDVEHWPVANDGDDQSYRHMVAGAFKKHRADIEKQTERDPADLHPVEAL